MIELYQIPYSPFCIVTRKILEVAGTRFKTVNVPNGDRSLIWKITKQRYYQVPVLREGNHCVFETGGNSQVIAKYLDARHGLGLFPAAFEGLQDVLWSHIENEVEGYTFKLNDVYAEEFVPKSDWVRFLRHKERKFGAGCLDAWRAGKKGLLEGLEQALTPYEAMLRTHEFLLADSPVFVDFDLYGMLGNFLYTGHHRLPKSCHAIADWYARMTDLDCKTFKELSAD